MSGSPASASRSSGRSRWTAEWAQNDGSESGRGLPAICPVVHLALTSTEGVSCASQGDGAPQRSD